jgi:cytochrome c-type biogenesis protein CcmH/NrfF
MNTATNKSDTVAPIMNLNDKAVRNLADAIFKQLQSEGCQAKDIITVSSQLLGLVTDQIRENRTAQ